MQQQDHEAGHRGGPWWKLARTFRRGPGRTRATGGPSPPWRPRAIIAVAGLAGLVGALVGVWLAPWLVAPVLPLAGGVPALPSPPGGYRSSPAEAIARAVGPSVVGVASTFLVKDPRTGETIVAARTTGSGVIFDARGFIVTNHHVVSMPRGGADVHPQVIEVLLSGGRRVRARLLAEDYPYSDLAVLRVDPRETGPLQPARFADPLRVRVGEWVVAIGNPAGLFRSVSLGIVSGVREELFQPVPLQGDGDPVVGDRIFRLIQTDAAINPGNSGGALVDSSGRVIGINTVKIAGGGDARAGFEGLGFAIPSDDVARIARDLVRYGRVRRPALGLRVADIAQLPALLHGRPELAARFRHALARKEGAVVWRVYPGSPAAQAGLRPGDVIAGLDGHSITDTVDLVRAIDGRAIGETVELEVVRAGRKLRVDARLAELRP
ncbi:MAG TPA: trypsin-like peptidase domain-containing protein [Thermaerobacter sp.]